MEVGCLLSYGQVLPWLLMPGGDFHQVNMNRFGVDELKIFKMGGRCRLVGDGPNKWTRPRV